MGEKKHHGKHEKRAKHRQSGEEDVIEGNVRDPEFRSKINDAAMRRGEAEPVLHHKPQSEDAKENGS